MSRGATASLAVSITARTSKFIKGMATARKSLMRFGASAAAMGKKLARMGAIAGGVAAAGIALLTKRAFSAVDAISKLAQRSGDTTEAIVGLQHSAELMGSSAAEMSKALDFMSKSMGEAAMGTGEAEQALKFLNLDVQKLIRMRPSEAFIKIAEATSKLATQSEKAAIASDIFSRSGVKLVNVLDLGAEGIRKNTEEAKLMGLAFSNVSGEKIAEANDQVKRLKERMDGLGRAIAGSLAPIITGVAKSIGAFAEEGVEKVGGLNLVIDRLIDKLAFAGDMITRMWDLLDVPFQAPQAIIANLAKGFDDVFVRKFEDAAGAVGQGIRGFLGFEKQKRIGRSSIGNFLEDFAGGIQQNLAKQLERGERLKAGVGGFQGQVDRFRADEVKRAAKAKKLSELTQETAAIATKAAAEQGKAAENIRLATEREKAARDARRVVGTGGLVGGLAAMGRDFAASFAGALGRQAAGAKLIKGTLAPLAEVFLNPFALVSRFASRALGLSSASDVSSVSGAKGIAESRVIGGSEFDIRHTALGSNVFRQPKKQGGEKVHDDTLDQTIRDVVGGKLDDLISAVTGGIVAVVGP